MAFATQTEQTSHLTAMSYDGCVDEGYVFLKSDDVWLGKNNIA